MRKPKFEIFTTNDGQFQFRLKAANGEPIMTGRAYDSKYGVMHAIAHVMKEAQEEIRFVRKASANYKFFFQLRSKSGRLIGWSQLYQTRQGRDNGIRAVQTAIKWGRVEDLTKLQIA
ncbi:MAG: YegP family protein [Bacteroidota bacterium]